MTKFCFSKFRHKKETLKWDADDLGVIAQGKNDQFNMGQNPSSEQVHEWIRSAATGMHSPEMYSPGVP